MMKKKLNKSQKKSSPNRPLTLKEYWLKGRWVDRPKDIPLSIVDQWGALKNIPENPSQIPQFIDSLPHADLKQYVENHLKKRVEEQKWEEPIPLDTLKQWEEWSNSGHFDKLTDAKVKMLDKKILENIDDVKTLLTPPPLEKILREHSWKTLKINYSCNLYSLFLNVLVCLTDITAQRYGIRDDICEIILKEIFKFKPWRTLKEYHENYTDKGKRWLEAGQLAFAEAVNKLKQDGIDSIKVFGKYVYDTARQKYSEDLYGKPGKRNVLKDAISIKEATLSSDYIQQTLGISEQTKAGEMYRKFSGLQRTTKNILMLSNLGWKHKEIAEFLKCSTKTIQRALKKGE